jgi:hypothetical protein
LNPAFCATSSSIDGNYNCVARSLSWWLALLMKRFWLRVALVPVVATLAYAGLLAFPEPLFYWSIRAADLTLYSDRYFPPEAGRRVLELTHAKLASSPLFRAGDHYEIFVCNARWRQRLFFGLNYGVGGLNYYPITSNVFIRDSLIDQDRVVAPSGKLVGPDRPLNYYAAHEITHTLAKRAVGWYCHFKLPRWIREGYADYVGKGSSFKYADAERAFASDAREMDPQKSGLYLRYNLLVAHLLNKEHWTVERLFSEPIDQKTIEALIRRSAGQTQSR